MTKAGQMNFRRSYVLLLSILFLATLLAGCASSISSSELLARIGKGGPEVAVVDVRTKGEFRKGHLPGAVNIGILGLPFRLDEIPVESKDDPLVVYCAHGPRAGLAGFMLRIAGFKKVFHLDGDMNGWRANGLPVED
jgi:rhodanese-related sulfurtransferase